MTSVSLMASVAGQLALHPGTGCTIFFCSEHPFLHHLINGSEQYSQVWYELPVKFTETHQMLYIIFRAKE